jgi:pilus assembly protein CpaB
MIVALVLAGGITYFVYRRLRANVAKIPMTHIVAAVKDVPPGVALVTEDVGLIEWPAAAPLEGSFSKTEDVVGRPLIYPLGKGEPVMKRDLADPGSGIGLSVKIPPGMRATSVRSNEVTGVAGFLFPGSHVDVLGTFHIPSNPEPVTYTILQNVEVLTAGTKTEPDPSGKPQTVTVVTFLLSPEDSQKLLLASSQGTLQFVLRNGADQAKDAVPPIDLAELTSGTKTPQPAVHHTAPRQVLARRVVEAPPPSTIVVEVIQGQARKEEKFPETPKEGSDKNQ